VVSVVWNEFGDLVKCFVNIYIVIGGVFGK